MFYRYFLNNLVVYNIFYLTTSNNKNEFVNYNTGIELHIQTAETHLSHVIHIQHPRYDHWTKTLTNFEF